MLKCRNAMEYVLLHMNMYMCVVFHRCGLTAPFLFFSPGKNQFQFFQTSVPKNMVAVNDGFYL